MKRILYSCLLLISMCLTKSLTAQTPQYYIYPNPQCYNTTGVYQATAEIVLNFPGATNYSWTVVSNSCTPSFTATPGGAPTNTQIAITIPCCGDYTVFCLAYNGTQALGTVTISTFLSGNQNNGVIYCPNNAAITPSFQTICSGATATITGSGAATYTWSAPGGTLSTFTVQPTVNTCYTYTGTTAQGCTITPPTSACVSVQAISVSASPASQTMCAGSPVNFTATAAVLTTSVTAGTSISSYSWYAPGNYPPVPGNAFSGTANSTTSNATAGNYLVVVTHTGAAGTCTAQAISTVVIAASIPYSITPSSFSICPNGCLTLTAVSLQTAVPPPTGAGSYTWTQNFPGPAFSFVNNGNPLIRCPGPNVFPRTYILDGDYFGCPFSSTVTIGLLALTPTLTSSVGSALTSCPGQSIMLTASGGVTYTFSANPAAGTPTNPIPKAGATTPTVIHVPSGANFPIQYCVSTASTGCTGTTCITVNQRTLNPVLRINGSTTPSICPGTEFTLSTTNVGTLGTTYVYTSTYTPFTLVPGTSPSQSIHTATGANTVLPQNYTVTVDSAGCTGTSQVTLSRLILTPTLTASSPSICAGTQLTLTASGPATSYTFTAPSGVISPMPTYLFDTISHTPPLGGTITVVGYTVNVDSLTCSGVATRTVGILNLGPTMLVTPSAASICPGTAISFSATGAVNYTFISPSSGVFTVASVPNKSSIATGTDLASPAFIPISGVTYTFNGDSAGCVGTKTLSIKEHILKPTIALSPTLVCKGQPVTLTASGVIPGVGVNYTFTSVLPPSPPALPLPVNSSIGSFSTTDTPTAAVCYSVYVDSVGCKAFSPPQCITLRPDLALIPSASAASVCPGLTATLSVAGPTAATSIVYSWTMTSGSPSGSIAPYPLPTDSVIVYPVTNSTYSINAIDSLGCVGSTVITVGVDPINLTFPIVLSSSGSTICAGQQVTLTATSTISPNNNTTIGNITYTWTPTNGLIPASGLSATVVGSPSITTVYTVLASNPFGCVAQNTIDIPVGAYPIPVIVPTAYSVCAGFTSTLTAFGANSYTWTGTSFTNAIVQQSISVGVGAYTVIASNGGGCTATANQPIGTAPDLSITITAAPLSLTTCITSNSPKFSKPVHLTAAGAGSYVWFPYNPNVMTYSLGPQTDVRPPASTCFTVIGSTAICSGSNNICINVIPQFTMNVTPPLPAMCLGDTLKLSIVNIQPVLAVGPVSAFTYSWTEPLNAPPISISNYFTPTVTVWPQNTGTYTTEVRDSRECISLPRLVTVTVLPQPMTAIAVPTINSVATNTVCFVGLNPGAQDVTINLTGLNTNTGLQFGIVPTYTWLSPYGPPYNSILTPANNAAVTVNAPIRELRGSTVVVYTLQSGYNGVQGCRRQDTVSVRVIDCRPVRNIKFTTVDDNDTICARTCITFKSLVDTMAGGPQKLTWQFPGGSPNTSTLTNPTICYNFPGKYNVILKVANPYPIFDLNGGPPGSTLSAGTLSYVKVVDIPNVTILAPGQLRSDTTIRFGQAVDLHGSGALTYDWAPGYNISSLTNPKVNVKPLRTTQYILTGYNSKQCSSSDTINVIVIDDCGEMYVPNAFTPNNDGANDVLYVRGICLESLTFMVFNRWGEKVFETVDQTLGWDGTYKGEEMNTGVFVFRLEGKTYDGKAFSAKGNITLIR